MLNALNMRLKSFYGSTMTEAMRLVRESMGEHAIIVATRDEPDTGGVRVTAAFDETAQTNVPSHTSKAPPTGADSIDSIATALVDHAVPTVLAEKILACATPFAGEDAVVALGAALDTHFSFTPPDIAYKPQRPLVMIGPPGAGKTLCAAKLATKAALEKRKIALIGADTQRAGGMAQLAAFARILKTEILEVEDAPALRDAVSIQPKESLVFVDTAGCNPFDVDQRRALIALLRDVPADPCLVLPSDWEPETAGAAAKIFADLGVKRLIATRLDMMRRIGGLLRAAHDSRLPLYLFSASANVTAPLLPFNPVSLARLVLSEKTNARPSVAGVAR